MGLFDWLRPKQPRSCSDVARDLAIVVFGLHPRADDRVEIRLVEGRIVAMDVPGGDPSVVLAATIDRGAERGAAVAQALVARAEPRSFVSS